MFANQDAFSQLHAIIYSGGKAQQEDDYIKEYEKELKESYSKREICPECGSECTVKFTGEWNTCTECGCDIEIEIDQGQEWRFYGASDSKSSDPTRVGQPINENFNSTGGTYVSQTYGNSNHWKYQQKIIKWANSETKDRSLNKTFNHMATHGKLMNLNKKIIELGEKYYTEIKKIQISRAGNRIALEAACLYEACVNYGVPRTIKEFADAFNIDKTLMTKGYKRFRTFVKQLYNKGVKLVSKKYIEPTSAVDFLERYCSNLNIDDRMIERCKYVATKVQELNLAPTNTPTSIAAGSIYFISMIYNLGITRDHIKKATKGVSKVTINKCFMTLYTHKSTLIMSEEELEKTMEHR
jgi:transcription initiation factor TFIIB